MRSRASSVFGNRLQGQSALGEEAKKPYSKNLTQDQIPASVSKDKFYINPSQIIIGNG